MRCEAVSPPHEGASSPLNQVEGTPLESQTDKGCLQEEGFQLIPSGGSCRGSEALSKQSREGSFWVWLLGAGCRTGLQTAEGISWSPLCQYGPLVWCLGSGQGEPPPEQWSTVHGGSSVLPQTRGLEINRKVRATDRPKWPLIQATEKGWDYV